jgi:beta-mannosidase
VEVQGGNADDVLWDDNGVDLVPGEACKLFVKGLNTGDEEKLIFRWLGGSS